jgi:phosphoribosyl 1,2-cyclic phosphodiesterase
MTTSLRVCSLNSGSNANCYYVGNATDAVLIDAGLSARETIKRLQQRSLNEQAIRAILISHEHSDHIKGLPVLARQLNIPVYASAQTFRFLGLSDDAQQRTIQDALPLAIGTLQIMPFQKFHDAAEPLSFVISCDGLHVGVFTDLGRACTNLIHYFKQCHAAFLESNYDADWLEKGPYPLHLKKRIRGGEGHLSNTEALALLETHYSEQLTHLWLSHLSQTNNHPDRVMELFRPFQEKLHVSVASRYESSAVFQIESERRFALTPHRNPVLKQARLFG